MSHFPETALQLALQHPFPVWSQKPQNWCSNWWLYIIRHEAGIPYNLRVPLYNQAQILALFKVV